MRKTIACLSALAVIIAFVPTPTYAAAVFVNSASNENTGSGSSIAAAATSLTAGNLIVVVTNEQSASVIGFNVTDTAGNTYHQAGTTFNVTGNSNNFSIYYAYNALGNAGNVVTATLVSGSASFLEIGTFQFSGFGASDPLGSQTAAQGSSAAPTTSVLPITGNSSVIVAFVLAFGQGLSPGTGFNGTPTPSGFFMGEYGIVTTSQAAVANSANNTWGITAAIFNTPGTPAPAGVTAPTVLIKGGSTIIRGGSTVIK